MMYIFDYFLLLSILASVICLSIYWPVASCLWLVATGLIALPFISFSQGTIFAYLIAMISLSGVFVLLLYMCLLSEVLFVGGNVSFWLFVAIGAAAYIWSFNNFMYVSWQTCSGLYNSAHLTLLKVELMFLLVLLMSSAIMISLHGPSREA